MLVLKSIAEGGLNALLIISVLKTTTIRRFKLISKKMPTTQVKTVFSQNKYFVFFVSVAIITRGKNPAIICYTVFQK